MIKLLKCEFKKTRRRYVWHTALGITALALVWALHGDYSGENSKFLLQNGWMMYLYQLPLVNAIFFPLLSMVIASRLADIEHKGKSLKQLCTLMEKGKLYDAKLLYGLAIICFSVVLSWTAAIISGKVNGFGGELPIRLYLMYLLFTLAPTIAIYMFQHSLSLIFKNQAIPFFAGIIGEIIGLFSIFLPQYPVLRKLTPWGYYGALQFVGLFGWSRETKYSTAYFEVMPVDWLVVAVLAVGMVVIYWTGRKIFCRKEV